MAFTSLPCCTWISYLCFATRHYVYAWPQRSWPLTFSDGEKIEEKRANYDWFCCDTLAKSESSIAHHTDIFTQMTLKFRVIYFIVGYVNRRSISRKFAARLRLRMQLSASIKNRIGGGMRTVTHLERHSADRISLMIDQAAYLRQGTVFLHLHAYTFPINRLVQRTLQNIL